MVTLHLDLRAAWQRSTQRTMITRCTNRSNERGEEKVFGSLDDDRRDTNAPGSRRAATPSPKPSGNHLMMTPVQQAPEPTVLSI